MRAIIISGSHRKQSESLRVSKFLENRLLALNVSTDCKIIDLGNHPLPMWDEGVFDNSEPWNSQWQETLDQIKMADFFILVSPEWAGMVTPALKNFLLLASGTGAMAHKPALIVSVSAGKGGAYPISELRASGYKNTALCFLPEHLILRQVQTLLNGETAQSEDDEYIRKRTDYALKLLNGYSKALREVRASGLVDQKTYPNGM